MAETTKAAKAAPAKATLPKSVFAVEVPNHQLLKLAYDAFLANGRQASATTLQRGEVRLPLEGHALADREAGALRAARRIRRELSRQTARLLRPLRRREDRMERPARVRMRRRKPWVLCRRRLFGW